MLWRNLSACGFWLLISVACGPAVAASLSDCEGPLREFRTSIESVYISSSRKNARPPARIAPLANEEIAFGLNLKPNESSEIRDVLGRLNALEKYLAKKKSGAIADDDLRIGLAIGQAEIEKSLQGLDSRSAGLRTRFEGWADLADDNAMLGSIGVSIPDRVFGVPIPKNFLATLFGVWVFPGPLSYSLLGGDYFKGLLSSPSILSTIATQLGPDKLSWYQEWVLPHSPQLAATAAVLLASLYARYRDRLPRAETVLDQSGLDSAEEDADDDDNDFEIDLKPVAAQFADFLQAMRNPVQGNLPGPRYFATSYFDAGSVGPDADEPDEEESNRALDLLHFYRNDGTPVLIYFDRKVEQ